MPLRPREWRVRLNDIIEAAERAISYTDTHTFEQFAAEPRTVDAVSYAIVIVGEAAGHIPDRVTSAAPEGDPGPISAGCETRSPTSTSAWT